MDRHPETGQPLPAGATVTKVRGGLREEFGGKAVNATLVSGVKHNGIDHFAGEETELPLSLLASKPYLVDPDSDVGKAAAELVADAVTQGRAEDEKAALAAADAESAEKVKAAEKVLADAKAAKKGKGK